MFALIYFSRAKEPFSEDQLATLAEKARHKNQQLSVTGLLNYHRGHFFQYLEGDEAEVRALMDTIQQDSRHTVGGIKYLPTFLSRRFEDWMFVRYVPPETVGYIDLVGLLRDTVFHPTVYVASPDFKNDHAGQRMVRVVDRLANYYRKNKKS